MKKINMRILGIESSCDEAAAAVVENGRVIESSVIASQVDLHAQFGGVYPELASREHVKAVYATVNEALQQAHMGITDLDGIAVTRGPGLAGSLVVGVNLAKGLALAADLPIVGVNHLEGHLYSAWLYAAGSNPTPEPKFPLVALLVSGGHTELVLMRDHLQYQMLGGTSDDAAGEAFDKVARLLELPYPGGPSIQKSAMEGNPRAFNFPKARLSEPWNFSFSGLKPPCCAPWKNSNLPKNPCQRGYRRQFPGGCGWGTLRKDNRGSQGIWCARDYRRRRCQRQQSPARSLPLPNRLPRAHSAYQPLHG